MKYTKIDENLNGINFEIELLRLENKNTAQMIMDLANLRNELANQISHLRIKMEKNMDRQFDLTDTLKDFT